MTKIEELRRELARRDPTKPTWELRWKPLYNYSYPELKTMKLIPVRTEYGSDYTVSHAVDAVGYAVAHMRKKMEAVRVMDRWRNKLVTDVEDHLVGVRLDGPSGQWTALVVTFKTEPSPYTMRVIQWLSKHRPPELDIRIEWST